MPKLSSETVTLLDGDIRVFKRARSRAWQATFKMDGTWVRVSTKCKQLAEAKVEKLVVFDPLMLVTTLISFGWS